MHGHAGHDGAHGVLADAVVEQAAAGVPDRLGGGPGQCHAGVAGQVGTARQEPGQLVGGGVEAGLDGLAGGHGPVLGGEGREGRFPPGQAVAAQGRVEPRPVAVPGLEARLPVGPHRLAARDGGRGTWPSTSSGTQKVESTGRPRISLVSRASSSENGSPWALAESVRFGDG